MLNLPDSDDCARNVEGGNSFLPLSAQPRVALIIGPAGRPEVLAMSDDPTLTAEVADRLLDRQGSVSRDPLIAAVQRGRRQALYQIRGRPAPKFEVLTIAP